MTDAGLLYQNAVVKSRESTLLTADRLQRVSDAQDLEEAVRLLVEAGYPSASSPENEGYFTQVNCAAHVLGVIYPDANLSVRDNSKMMCERDNKLRREAYERIYHRSINAPFHFSDIAGYKGCSPASSE